MGELLRRQRVIDWSHRTGVDRPDATVRRATVQVGDLPPVDVLVGLPPDPVGLTYHFAGFNADMGPWESAKCALWAAASRTVVAMCELPGISRHLGHLPPAIRQDLAAGDPRSLALATLACLDAGAAAADVPTDLGPLALMGFSTGCSLAAAALPTVQASREVSRLTLIEPVTLVDRRLPWLALDNTVDLLNTVAALPGDLVTPWVREVVRQQLTAPSLHFSMADFRALTSMLAGADTMARLLGGDDRVGQSLELQSQPEEGAPSARSAELASQPTGLAVLPGQPLPTTHLVRGALSRLTQRRAFEELDAGLSSRRVPGLTCLVPRVGHQLWHSLPVLAALTAVLYPPEASAETA